MSICDEISDELSYEMTKNMFTIKGIDMSYSCGNDGIKEFVM